MVATMLDSWEEIAAICVLWFVAGQIESTRDSILQPFLTGTLERLGFDLTVLRFLLDVVRKGCFAAIMLTLTGLSQIDWVAVAAGAGMVIGLASQDTLSNFVSGFLLMWTRPFRIGERVRIGNCDGWVIGIGVFHTVLNSADHERFLIPNSKIFKEPIHNITYLHAVRARVSLSTPRESDCETIRQVLKDALTQVHDDIQKQASSDDRSNSPAGLGGRGFLVQNSPGPIVAIKTIGHHTVEWLLMVYCPSNSKNRVRDIMNTTALKALANAGIPRIRRGSVD